MSINLTVDEYIELFNKLSNSSKEEMGEQDDSGGSTGGGKSPTKRFDISSPKRGPANQLGNTKWSDGYSLTRGVANTLF
jgi:hypothetical protein